MSTKSVTTAHHLFRDGVVERRRKRQRRGKVRIEQKFPVLGPTQIVCQKKRTERRVAAVPEELLELGVVFVVLDDEDALASHAVRRLDDARTGRLGIREQLGRLLRHEVDRVLPREVVVRVGTVHVQRQLLDGQVGVHRLGIVDFRNERALLETGDGRLPVVDETLRRGALLQEGGERRSVHELFPRVRAHMKKHWAKKTTGECNSEGEDDAV